VALTLGSLKKWLDYLVMHVLSDCGRCLILCDQLAKYSSREILGRQYSLVDRLLHHSLSSFLRTVTLLSKVATLASR
jgi:hypothetical protein